MSTFFIRNPTNGLVLDIRDSGVPGDLIEVVVAVQTDSPSQQWRFEPGGFVVHDATGFVLDIQGAGPIGSPLLVGRRNATLANNAQSNQQWSLDGMGRLVSRFDSSGLGVEGGQTVPGARVVSVDLVAARGPEMQRWTRWFEAASAQAA